MVILKKNIVLTFKLSVFVSGSIFKSLSLMMIDLSKILDFRNRKHKHRPICICRSKNAFDLKRHRQLASFAGFERLALLLKVKRDHNNHSKSSVHARV